MLAWPGFRQHTLDGAMLYFDPRRGLNVRIEDASTRGLRRLAPRAVMFGITSACNLRCEYCSRDAALPGRWTVASAAEVLADLSSAGVLEVAFGGGEPLVFAGFAELVQELARTPLAVHVTTNGTLLPAMWPRLRGKLGMIRLSLHDPQSWRPAAQALAGERWGANLLVDREALPTLPARLAELAALGASDVSILTYVGQLERQLDAAGNQRLADCLRDAPLPVRLSVCAGDRVPVPRLFATGDCGAGLDFVSITPDQRVQSCSFKHDGWPASTASEILAAWREQRAALTTPSPRAGCARRLPQASQPTPAVAVWQAFSGNNSGECVAVARFATVAEAEGFLAELLPGWTADEPYGAAWRELFAREQVVHAGTSLDWRVSPRELVAIGNSVLATTVEADDAFPELRALGWKRGATMLGGVHIHEGLGAVAAIRCASADDVATVTARDRHLDTRLWPHGDRLLVTMPWKDRSKDTPDSLAAVKDYLEHLADGRPLAAELTVVPFNDDDLLAVKQRLGSVLPETPRLVATFWGPLDQDRAGDFCRALGDQPHLRAGRTVLFEGVERPKRLAVLAHRANAHVYLTWSSQVRIEASVWTEASRGQPRRPLDRERLQVRLAAVQGLSELRVFEQHQAVRVSAVSSNPGPALVAIAGWAGEQGGHSNLGIVERDPLAWTLRRVLADV